jgi:hypothetical protein
MARTKGDHPALTPVERVNKSLAELVARGGRRFNLKLSPEANEALKVIAAIEGFCEDTTAINQTLIERSRQLKAQQNEEHEEKK